MALRPYGQGIEDFREVIRQTLVLSESVLLVPLGSFVALLTDAVFVIVPGVRGLTTTETVSELLPLTWGKSHVTVPLEWTQLPLDGETDTNVTVDGS
jgi:hypothetical protein